MIISSGQTLTGKAAEDLQAVIKKLDDPSGKGFGYYAYKALKVAESPDGADSEVNGCWVTVAGSGDDDDFVGVVSEDTIPQANIELNSGNPVLSYGPTDYNVKQGGVVAFDRNGMVSVLAGGNVTEGDFLKLGDDGTFVKDASGTQASIGRAYESAKEGERFVAFIRAL